MVRRVIVSEYDPAWIEAYKRRAQELQELLGDELLMVHHIGSTSVPGMSAKPTIDLLPVVRSVERLDAYDKVMTDHGYQPRGENGIPGRRYYMCGTADLHLCHVHAFADGDPEIGRHLDFRDYIIAHPVDAERYAKLKHALAERFPTDASSYVAGKSQLIQEMDRRAALWRSSREEPEALWAEIELASLKAWPGFVDERQAGWAIRFADGHTKRANSVTVLSADDERMLPTRVVDIEEWYRARGLAPTFRMVSFRDLSRLKEILDYRGYASVSPSSVWVRDMNEMGDGPVKGDCEMECDLDGWLATWCRLRGDDPNDHAIHREIIAKSQGEQLWAVRYDKSRAAACAMGVVTDGLFGLFDLFVEPAMRQRGHARSLLAAMLCWACSVDAHHAYLQVEQANAPALGLYHSLGYRHAYDYIYRVAKG